MPREVSISGRQDGNRKWMVLSAVMLGVIMGPIDGSIVNVFLPGIANYFQTDYAVAQWVFEMKVRECSDDRLSIDFHYCPLVKAWQKQGCTDKEIERLCDIAMSGDRGIAESYGCAMDLPKTIAKGDDVCQIRFHR